MKKYETEAQERWGDTSAYREHEQKTKNYTKEKWDEANNGLMAIFAEFATCKDSGESVDSAEAQALVAKLQTHITENYYTCTDEILAGLGHMYIADERFKKKIDKYGEGTAEFVAEAISINRSISVIEEHPTLQKYWGDRKYKHLQCRLKMQEFSDKEKVQMSMDIIHYIREKGYVLYHDFMDDISKSHPDWFNMLTFDKSQNKSILTYIKNKAKRRK